jgi:hypothetical protein
MARIRAARAWNPAAVAITGGTIANATLSGTTNGVYIFAQCGIPFIVCATGTMGNNGAMTLGTALTTTYSGGGYFWVPAGAVAAGVPAAATWYYGVASSTTAVTLFNNTYSSGIPTIPSSPTAFVTTGPGAFAGDTAIISGPTITLTAGALGPNGALELEVMYAATNNANTKTANATVGAATPLNQSLSVDITQRAMAEFRNAGSQSINKGFAVGLTGAGTVRQTAQTWTAIDTSAAATVIVKAGHSTATDNIVIEGWKMRVCYGP